MPNKSRNPRGNNTRNNVRPDGSQSNKTTWPAAGGVFSRLKIPCPNYLLTFPDSICYTTTTIPITFRSLPTYVNSICSHMSSIKLRSLYDSDSDSEFEDELSPISPENKTVLMKGALLLAETKVHLSGTSWPHLERDERYYEVLHMMKELARTLPKPLVEYLECIGVVRAGRQEVRPVLAGAGGAGDEGHGDSAGGGAAPALAPCQLAPLLARLRGGVPAGGPQDPRAALRALALRWEETDGTLRLADDCFRRWVADAGPHVAPRYTLRWDNKDNALFQRIINSVRYCKDGKDFFASIDLDRREGTQAQFVQTPEWNEDKCYAWYTMTAVGEEALAKGAVFGFGGAGSHWPSRFSGTIETSYQSGEANFYHQIKNEMEWKNIKTNPQLGITVPVSFSSLPGFVKSWINRYRSTEYQDISNLEALFVKLGLILAEAKVYFAQTASKRTILHPDQLVLYPWQWISTVKHMTKWLPKPLAIYLECIGNTYAEGQEVTPVLAGGAGGGAVPALAPRQLAPLLARLRGGVPAGGPQDPRAELRALPLRWEEADDTLRLADDCFRRWVADAGPHVAPRYTLRWDHEDSRLFETAIRSKRDHHIYTDLTHGKGSPAQFVQRNTAAEYPEYFSMSDIDGASFKLGAAFLFSDHTEQSPRFSGTQQTAYIRDYYERPENVLTAIINDFLPYW